MVLLAGACDVDRALFPVNLWRGLRLAGCMACPGLLRTLAALLNLECLDGIQLGRKTLPCQRPAMAVVATVFTVVMAPQRIQSTAMGVGECRDHNQTARQEEQTRFHDLRHTLRQKLGRNSITSASARTRLLAVATVQTSYSRPSMCAWRCFAHASAVVCCPCSVLFLSTA